MPLCYSAGPRSHSPDTVVGRLVPGSSTGTIRPEAGGPLDPAAMTRGDAPNRRNTGRVGMAPFLVLRPSGIPYTLRAGAAGRSSACLPMPTGVETATPAEDLSVWMANYPTSPYDTSPEAPSKPGGSGGVPSLPCGRGGLLSPFLPMPTGASSMAGGGRGTPCHIIRRGVLDFSQQGYFSSGGRVAADFRHLMVSVAAP